MLDTLAILAAGLLNFAVEPLPANFPLGPGESRTFEITLNAGEYVRLSAQTERAALTGVLRQGPTRLAQMSSAGGSGGAVSLAAVPAVSGVYQLEIRRTDRQAFAAQVEINWIPPRPATDRDRAEASLYRAALDAKTPADFARLRREAEPFPDLVASLLASEVRALYAGAEYQTGLELAQAQLARPGNPPRVQAQLHYLAGLCQIQLEKNAESAGSFEAALVLQRELVQPYELGATLHNLSSAHFLMGQCEKALREAEEALEIRRTLGEPAREAFSMLAVAKAHVCLGDAQQALDGYRAVLPLWRQLKDQRNEGAALNDMGVVYAALGDWDDAARSYASALRLREAAGDVNGQAETVVNTAQLHLLTRDYKAALPLYDRALQFPAGPEYQRRLGYALEGKSEVLFHLGRKQEASAVLHESLAVLRKVGDRSAEAFTWRMLGQTENSIDAFTHAITISREVGDRLAEAVSLTELGRLQLRGRDPSPARATLEQAVGIIESSRASLADPRLRMDYLSASHDAYELLVEALPPSGFEAFRISERAHARTLLDAIGSGTTSPVASLAAIRAEALDAGTVLIEYFLGERRGWLWLVSRDAFESFALPGRSTIEPLVHRYYEALTARNAKIPGEAPEGRAQRLREAETSEQKSAAELSRMLLSPVRARLAGRRVLIVDDGPLRLAPFAALGVENEVVLVPSASYLVQARRAAGKAASSQKILILADPVFDTAGGAFPRLPQTRREAETIAALSPAGQVEKRLDYDASLASLRRASTAGFGTIHIATHAVVDSRHPELSGIILSQVDRNGKPQPGVLRLREIYNLHLNTGLVTLSACETAVGKDVSGEGMIGLSHAFLCAGAQRVVASLWKVEDAATAKLMESFYRGLYARKLSPPAALRAAQNELRADARWRSPYYWAGFVIEGDWR